MTNFVLSCVSAIAPKGESCDITGNIFDGTERGVFVVVCDDMMQNSYFWITEEAYIAEYLSNKLPKLRYLKGKRDE